MNNTFTEARSVVTEREMPHSPEKVWRALTPTITGTLLRMEQVGFPSDQPRFFQGAKAGWPRFFTALEHVLTKMDKGV